MSLGDYRRKRRFDATPEPEPGKPAPRGRRAIFVVQLHHASRRHYDFRLQVGDALKSWAVPKGPSYDPAVKRMAVEVEDHPLDYATFEGDIPKGHYGGGHVARFDDGVWATDGDAEAQLRKGHLRFELFGRKLKGGWHLVRSGKPAKQPQWLLFKDDDAYAGTLEADDLLADVAPPPAADAKRAGTGKADKKRLVAVAPKKRARRVDWAKKAAALPGARRRKLADAAFAPQLARLGDRPPEGDDWLHEIKWDGYRIVATILAGKARLWSRNGIEWTTKVPELREALERLGVDAAALDGELIAGAGTQEDFNLLQATLSGERQGALGYVLFDLLHLDGVDIAAAPLAERKRLLAALLGATPPAHLAYSSHIAGDGAAAFALAAERRFEGIISKRADRPYVHGRSDDWRKSKRLESDEFAVVGFTPGKGARATGFGSLLLARPDGAGGWTYVGRIGSGFDDATMRAITRRIGRLGGAEPTAAITPGQLKELGRTVRWFPPLFVVEANLRGTGGQGVLRQASLKAIRTDKDIADLVDSDRGGKGAGMATAKRVAKPAAKTATKAVSKAAASAATKVATKAAPKAAAKTAAKKGALPPVTISSPDKVVFAESGLTKADVAAYYAAVMPLLLPEVVGRPLSVIRCPDGTGGACFFQKHLTAGLKRVGTQRLKEESGRNADYLVVEDAEGLMELVQFNSLEFHPWGSHARAPDLADRVVFDLDPGPGVPFAQVRRAAADLRDKLESIGLQSFLRTTGGKGLHVVVPLNPGCDWDLVKRFAQGFAAALAGAEPDRFIAVSTLSKRPGKIFVDYLRNGRGATAVASYSLRARPGAPVAMPLPWSALPRLKSGDQYTLGNVPAHLRRRGDDPWAGIGRLRQNLKRWARTQ
jgi:bifunctional non-homologous end joining protein LigD